jgi:SP family sugar:H+ symporter-like MFS transporter
MSSSVSGTASSGNSHKEDAPTPETITVTDTNEVAVSVSGSSSESVSFNSIHLSQNEKENVTETSLSMFQLLAKHWFVSILCMMVAFGGFVFGWDTGTISGFVQMSNFKDRFGSLSTTTNSYEFTNTRVGLIISIFNIGCAAGGITLAKLGDKFGRKLGLIIVMTVYIVGIVVQISSAHWIQYMIGRIVSGLAVGAVSVLSPMFIAETSPSEIRGIMVSCYQLMITLGILVGYVTTFGTVHSFDDTRQWRIPLGLCFAWALFMIGGMLLLPESARYLIENGKLEEAKKSIAKVNGLTVNDETVLLEMETIYIAITEQQEAGDASWKELVTGKPHLLTRLLIGIALQSFQQLTGNNYFFYYGTSIFKSVGLEDSFVTSIILGLVNFLSTFIALYTIGKVGRRDNLILGSACMAACLLVFSVIGTTILYPHGVGMPTDPQAGIAMIVLTCVFIFIFAVTWAPGVFVVVSETYPLRIRSKGMALATAANWIWGFLIAFFTPLITAHIRFSYGFVFFGATVAGLIFVYLMVPETEGLTLEAIDTLYSHYKPFYAHEARADYKQYLVEEEHKNRPQTSSSPRMNIPWYGFENEV